MIPTGQPAPVRGRLFGVLRSAIALAFVASGILHAVALSWGLASAERASPAGSGSLPLQVRLAAPDPAQAKQPIRPASVTTPPQVTKPQLAAVASDPEPVWRRLALPELTSPESQTVAADPLAAAAQREPMPAPAVVGVSTSPVALDAPLPDTARADYQALLRAAAERLQHYPERARRLGFEGTAVVAIELQPDGVAPRVVLVRSSGIGMLDRAAVELLDRASREVEPAIAPARQGQLRFPIRYALHDGRD